MAKTAQRMQRIREKKSVARKRAVALTHRAEACCPKRGAKPPKRQSVGRTRTWRPLATELHYVHPAPKGCQQTLPTPPTPTNPPTHAGHTHAPTNAGIDTNRPALAKRKPAHAPRQPRVQTRANHAAEGVPPTDPGTRTSTPAQAKTKRLASPVPLAHVHVRKRR